MDDVGLTGKERPVLSRSLVLTGKRPGARRGAAALTGKERSIRGC
jgi:hypothetical protein